MEALARRGSPSGGGAEQRATSYAELHQRLGRALAGKLRLAIGASRFAPDGRLTSLDDALVPGVDASLLDALARDSCAAGLRQPASPTALAVNSFLNWRATPGLLDLAGLKGFRELHFCARCPTGVRGTPPLLDVVALGDQGVVAVAARTVEYLTEPGGRLAPAYAGLKLGDGLSAWNALLDDGGTRFKRVDAPALVKKAIGLANTFPERRVRLLYLYLEPEGAAALAPFAAHRAELAELALRTSGSAVGLHAQSFGELWDGWSALGEPPWLREIAARLRARYAVAAAG